MKVDASALENVPELDYQEDEEVTEQDSIGTLRLVKFLFEQFLLLTIFPTPPVHLDHVVLHCISSASSTFKFPVF